MSEKIDFTTFGDNYSTTEINTNYTWIDGKKIYKKTIYIPSLPNTTEIGYAHGVSGMTMLVDIQGIMIAGSGVWWPLGQIPNPGGANLSSGIRLVVTTTNINISVGSDRSNYSAYITIWYTKG